MITQDNAGVRKKYPFSATLDQHLNKPEGNALAHAIASGSE